MKRHLTLALACALIHTPSMSQQVLYLSDGAGEVSVYGSYSRTGYGGYVNTYNANRYSEGTYREDGYFRPVLTAAAMNLSSDVRCNPLARTNEDVMTTTSASDTLGQYMAANILFRLIQAQMGLSFRTALAVLPKATGILNGQEAVLWKTTWHDGSTSTFLVFPGLPPQFMDQQPEVGGTTPPTGITTCPRMG